MPPADETSGQSLAPGRRMGARAGATDPPGSPWRTESSREVYRNPWLTVTEYHVIRPDGTPGVYGVVDPRDNVTVVALTDDEQVYIIEDFLYPIGSRAWLLPSGAVDPGEPPLNAAQRELEEEVGLTASDWTALGDYYLSPGISPQRTHLYLARGLTQGSHRREGTESAMTMRLEPLRDAYRACLRGDGQVAVAALGLWLAWTTLHSERPTHPGES